MLNGVLALNSPSYSHTKQGLKQVSPSDPLGQLIEGASAGHAALQQIVLCSGRSSLQIEVSYC